MCEKHIWSIKLFFVILMAVLGCLLFKMFPSREFDRHVIVGDANAQFDVSRVRLPNEWKIDLLGDSRRITLMRVGVVGPGDDHCKVEFAGVVSIGGGELPFSIEVDFEPIDSHELYVSRIGDFSVPQDKAIEKELKKVSRLYCNHLQKTLLVK